LLLSPDLTLLLLLLDLDLPLLLLLDLDLTLLLLLSPCLLLLLLADLAIILSPLLLGRRSLAFRLLLVSFVPPPVFALGAHIGRKQHRDSTKQTCC